MNSVTITLQLSIPRHVLPAHFQTFLLDTVPCFLLVSKYTSHTLFKPIFKLYSSSNQNHLFFVLKYTMNFDVCCGNIRGENNTVIFFLLNYEDLNNLQACSFSENTRKGWPN